MEVLLGGEGVRVGGRVNAVSEEIRFPIPAMSPWWAPVVPFLSRIQSARDRDAGVAPTVVRRVMWRGQHWVRTACRDERSRTRQEECTSESRHVDRNTSSGGLGYR